MTMSRKGFIQRAFGYLAAAAAGSVGASLFSDPAHARQERPPWPWPYTALEPEEGGKVAHDAFYEYGCAYAGFSGLMKPLQAKVGEPFTAVPLEIMSYGGAGVKGWGTLCGALNGVSAAISLVCDEKSSTKIIDEILSWYGQVRLPTTRTNELGENGGFGVDKKIKALPQSRSGSPLCHLSVTRWCKASGFSVDSPERFERCARISADVAAMAIGILNQRTQTTYEARYGVSAAAFECNKCHGAGREEADVLAKMDCVPCHGDPHR